jgi:predicted aminopeptidase
LSKWPSLAARSLLGIVWLGGASGCSSMSYDLGYYLQSIGGHLTVMQQARPIDELLGDPSLDPKLRAKLERVREVRAFASRELGLPDNGSYTRYADLHRPFVIWNVFATPELSMRLTEWCFPIAGCISYRGYYAKEDADRFGENLRANGYDVYVAGVPAYSTLGWFDDPVLNTFIQYPDGEVARLVFHELAHQVLYVKGDSAFNESFATTVEEVGVERWLASKHDGQLELAYRQFAERRVQFVAMLKKHRTALETVFAAPISDDEKRHGKTAVFEALQSDYRALKAGWDGWPGYDRWFSQKLTNAHLASVATYTERVPGFQRLLAGQGGDLRRFFAVARELSKRPKTERDQVLADPS